MEENWVKVFSTSFLAQAEINKAMLIENEVDAVVLNKLDSFIANPEFYAKYFSNDTEDKSGEQES